MAPAKMKLRVRKKESRSSKSSQQQALRPETSPDSKCPICLDRFVNVASVERCLHRFCFRCIREWAKNKAECPLCKQPFRSIFHSVRSENDFKEYVVLESSGGENATTSSSTAVTTSTPATPTLPLAGHNDPENGSSRTHRSATIRARERQRARNPAPSASSLDEVTLQNLLPWLPRDQVMGVSQLRPFLLARTDHILHELMNFARSFEAIERPPAPSYEEDSGSPSIINISEDDDSNEPDVSEVATPERIASVPVPTSSEISLSQSAWDDETPGPSYSTLSQLQSEAAESGGTQPEGTTCAEELHEQNDEEECMIVGYVKPMAERTPELVQLSSDTSEEEQEKEAATTEKPLPQAKVEPALPVYSASSPKSFPSTSHIDNKERSTQRHPQHKRQDNTRGCRSKSYSRSHSRSSSESSEMSPHPRKSDRQRQRLFQTEVKKRGQHLFFLYSDTSPAEDHTRPWEKSSSSFSPWDSPGHKKVRDKKKRRRKTRKRERLRERSRSPRDLRRRRGDRMPRPRSTSTSSSAESCPEKPGGKRKYKTRHLEKRVRHKNGKKLRDRERSPSVEIIYERLASDSHPHLHRWRKSKHKKSRKRTKNQNSPPTVITIDSDSIDEKQPSDHQDPFQGDCLTDSKENNPIANSWKKDNHKDYGTEFHRRTADFETDFREQLIGFQDLRSGAGHTTDPGHQDLQSSETACSTNKRQDSSVEVSNKAKNTGNPHIEGSSYTVGYKDPVTSHKADSQDHRTNCRDREEAISSSTFDYQTHKLSSSCHTTDFSVTGLSNSFANPKDCIPDSRDLTVDVNEDRVLSACGRSHTFKHSGPDTVSHGGDAGISEQTLDPTDCTVKDQGGTKVCKEGITGISSHSADSQEHDLGVTSTAVSSCTTPDFTDCAVDFQDYNESDAGASSKTLSSHSADTLNLEHFLVDIVNPKPEGILSREGQDQRGTGHMPHRDQSQAENESETIDD